MNLGERLKVAQALKEEVAQREILAKKAAHDEETLKMVMAVEHFFDYAFRLFEHRLLNGKVPGYVALGGKTFRLVASLLNTYRWDIPIQYSRQWREKGKGIWSPDHPCYELWVAFDERCKAAGLEPQWTSAHDGVGIESWYELTVSAA